MFENRMDGLTFLHEPHSYMPRPLYIIILMSLSDT
jgi:hypothetical protein